MFRKLSFLIVIFFITVITYSQSVMIYDLAVSTSGNLLATAGTQGVSLYNLTQNQLLFQFPINSSAYAVAFNPNSTKLAIALENSTIQIWDLASRQLLGTLIGHMDRATTLAWSPNGQFLVSTNASGVEMSIYIWDALTYQKLKVQYDIPVVDAQWSDNVNIYFASTLSGVFQYPQTLVDSEGRRIGSYTTVFSLARNPTNTWLAIGTQSGNLEIWDTVTNQMIKSLDAHNDALFDLDWHPNGIQLASASLDNTVKLWDTRSGLLLNTISTSGDVRAVEFSPDGGQLVYGGAGTTSPQIVTLPNRNPKANAGADLTATAVSTTQRRATLNGSQSYDVDGTINAYRWRNASNVTVGTTATLTVYLEQRPTSYTTTFTLRVTDDDGAFHSDTVNVYVPSRFQPCTNNCTPPPSPTPQ